MRRESSGMLRRGMIEGRIARLHSKQAAALPEA
jgi:hypothetical protein